MPKSQPTCTGSTDSASTHTTKIDVRIWRCSLQVGQAQKPSVVRGRHGYRVELYVQVLRARSPGPLIICEYKHLSIHHTDIFITYTCIGSIKQNKINNKRSFHKVIQSSIKFNCCLVLLLSYCRLPCWNRKYLNYY